jgi:hypothetical protein
MWDSSKDDDKLCYEFSYVGVMAERKDGRSQRG